MLMTWISIAATLTQLTAAAVLHAPLQARVSVDPVTCEQYEKYVGVYDNKYSYSPGCADVTFACLAQNGTSIWSHQPCVAAATCQGTTGVITLNQCQNPNVLTAGDIPNLAFTIYTNIVGSCAPDGCPITQQNYIDFIYGAMSAANVTEWPRYGSSPLRVGACPDNVLSPPQLCRRCDHPMMAAHLGMDRNRRHHSVHQLQQLAPLVELVN
ncbi:hypothetical protein MSAN_01605300 [Mycena sanguinolenta]|uniref:Uncharacterized protein n=1 Tax=Mycena sanguinolenta TaxID=230812 RepID=A0A8H6Y3W0_9AGAR|nr:hypothetical protein MSAN_01605300 [Mycena sanguinolenta]